MEEPGFDEVSEEEIQAAAEVDAGTLAAAPRAKRKLYTEMTPEMYVCMLFISTVDQPRKDGARLRHPVG